MDSVALVLSNVSASRACARQLLTFELVQWSIRTLHFFAQIILHFNRALNSVDFGTDTYVRVSVIPPSAFGSVRTNHLHLTLRILVDRATAVVTRACYKTQGSARIWRAVGMSSRWGTQETDEVPKGQSIYLLQRPRKPKA